MIMLNHLEEKIVAIIIYFWKVDRSSRLLINKWRSRHGSLALLSTVYEHFIAFMDIVAADRSGLNTRIISIFAESANAGNMSRVVYV